MILAVCLNPALDVTHQVARADWAGVNRPSEVQSRSGGKGVNVARVLRSLGQPVTLAGLAGGPAGDALAAGLAGTGIELALTKIEGDTRRTFAVADRDRGTTALFNEPGPAVSAEELARFFASYEGALARCAAVVLSGSLPPGVPPGAYADLIAAARRAGVPAILDTSGPPLSLGAAAGPAVIKPNLAELAELTDHELAAGDRPAPGRRPAPGLPGGWPGVGAGLDLPAVELAARALGGAGSTVVVSLGALGLLAAGPDGTWLAWPPAAVPGNPTGAGDAVVAGLAHGLVSGLDWPERIRASAALGTAAAAAPVAGEVFMADYLRLLELVTIAPVRLTPKPGPGR